MDFLTQGIVKFDQRISISLKCGDIFDTMTPEASLYQDELFKVIKSVLNEKNIEVKMARSSSFMVSINALENNDLTNPEVLKTCANLEDKLNSFINDLNSCPHFIHKEIQRNKLRSDNPGMFWMQSSDELASVFRCINLMEEVCTWLANRGYGYWRQILKSDAGNKHVNSFVSKNIDAIAHEVVSLINSNPISLEHVQNKIDFDIAMKEVLNSIEIGSRLLEFSATEFEEKYDQIRLAG